VLEIDPPESLRSPFLGAVDKVIILLIIYYIISTFVHEERTNTMSAGEMTAALQTDENTHMTVEECLMLAMQYFKCQQFMMNVC